MTKTIHRDKLILERLQQTGSASIQELAEALSVSVMTVHRDLNRLAAAGLAVKTHGGASLVPASMPGKDACAMCGKSVSERTSFLLHLSNGDQRRACCAHCGLMLHEQLPDIHQAMTADFLHPHMVSAGQATYVIQSELTVCCAPSVLSFGSRQDAQKFQNGFGGKLANMNEATQFLLGMMHSAQDKQPSVRRAHAGQAT